MPLNASIGGAYGSWLPGAYASIGGQGGVQRLGARPARFTPGLTGVGATNLANTNVRGANYKIYTGGSDLGSQRYAMLGGVGPVLEGVGFAACEGLDPRWTAACKGLVTLVTSSASPVAADPKCPEQTFRVPGSDVCVNPGHFLPGGQPLTMGAGGVAVIGSFGIPASTPHIVGQITDKDGNVSLIRRCSRGSVLGLDDLCYAKQILPRRNKFRKHRGAKRPPMSAADATALGRIGTLREKVKTLAKDANMSCKLR